MHCAMLINQMMLLFQCVTCLLCYCRTVFHVNCKCINSTAYHAVCVLLYVQVMIWIFNLKIKQFAVIRCVVLCVCYALTHTKMACKDRTVGLNFIFMMDQNKLLRDEKLKSFLGRSISSLHADILFLCDIYIELTSAD